jgi:hypothetical protein
VVDDEVVERLIWIQITMACHDHPNGKSGGHHRKYNEIEALVEPSLGRCIPASCAAPW